MITKKDYFKVITKEALRDNFKILINNLKEYSNNIEIYENGSDLYFSIKDIKKFGDYFKFISNFVYYNSFVENISEGEYLKNYSSYDSRNDLLEV